MDLPRTATNLQGPSGIAIAKECQRLPPRIVQAPTYVYVHITDVCSIRRVSQGFRDYVHVPGAAKKAQSQPRLDCGQNRVPKILVGRVPKVLVAQHCREVPRLPKRRFGCAPPSKHSKTP